MSQKQSKIQTLKKEIEVKDKLIGALLHEISMNKITLPAHIMGIIEIMYNNRLMETSTEIPTEIKQQEDTDNE